LGARNERKNLQSIFAESAFFLNKREFFLHNSGKRRFLKKRAKYTGVFQQIFENWSKRQNMLAFFQFTPPAWHLPPATDIRDA